MDEIEASLLRFGLSEFRPAQREIIDAVLAERPTIAVLPTGAGKSLCYQLPAVALGGLTLVVSPLISLMKDQVDALTARGIPASFINSSISASEREDRLAAAVRGELRLLYVAPERFRVPGFTDALRWVPLSLFAVDEAHCIVEWGHDFRPDYARLGEVVHALKPPRLLALTATATPDVRRQIRARLAMRDPAVFVRGFDRPNLHWSVQAADGHLDKLERCLTLLDEPQARGRPALIYAATRRNSEQVAEALGAHDIAAAAYHAGLPEALRADVQERWMANRLRVIVATNAFGMGVDKPDVRLVVHHALPGSAEAYYQEAGRAGRDGQPARCVLLMSHADVRLRQYLITHGDGGERSPERQRVDLARLKVIAGYAYGRGCRRAELLGYFGDPDRPKPGQSCGACDVCDELQPAHGDDDQLARTVLRCVAQLDGWFGRGRIARCLIGSTSRQVVEVGLDRLSTYGALRGKPQSFALDVLGALEAGGLLRTEGDEYPKLRLTPLGRDAVDGRAPIQVGLPRERSAASSRASPRPSFDPAFAHLRALRARLAAAEQLPAYCIFHDTTLLELVRQRPHDLDALSRIRGVGPTKLHKYGEAFLAALKEVA
jgi:ATP-dependent DNA helicase RecQ